MNKGALVRLVCTETGIESNQLERIDVHPGYSFFEVDEKAAPAILHKIESGIYEGKSFNVSVSQENVAPNKKVQKKRQQSGSPVQ